MKQTGSVWWKKSWGVGLCVLMIALLCMMIHPLMAAEVGLVPSVVCGQANPSVGNPWYPVCVGQQAVVQWRYTDGYTYVASPGEVCYQRTVDEVPVGARECSTSGAIDVTYNVAGLEDGSHVFGLKLLDAPANTTTIAVFPQPYTLDNVPGPRQGGQHVWSCPKDQGTRIGFGQQARGCAKVWYSGVGHAATGRLVPTRHPTVHTSVRLPETEMFVEHPIPLSGLYQPPPAFFQTKDGHTVIRGLSNHYTSHFMEAAEFADTLPRLDGPRGIGFVTNYSTYNIHPVTGDIWFVESVDHGRLGKITREGVVTTIAGHRTRSDALPYLPYQIGNNAANANTPWTTQLELVGQWLDLPGFYIPIDFVFDRTNPAIVYVADTGNQCIRKVDTSQDPALVTTLSGFCGPEEAGTAGFVDGSALASRFDWPFSITQVSTGLLYVADRGNDAIRRVFPDGRTETPVGLGYRPPPVNYGSGCATLRTHSRNGSFAVASIYHPMTVRATSTDDLLVVEDVTGLVRKIDRTNGQVLQILDITGQCVNYQTWIWMDVDREGTFGPIDDFFVVQDTGGAAFGVQTNEYFWRFDKNGGNRQRLVGNLGGSACHFETSADQSCGPHYPWAVAVGNGMVCANGWGETGFKCIRKKLPTDPQQPVYATAAHFGSQYLQGAGPLAMAYGPSPRTVHGWYGDGRLGAPGNDELAAMSDADLRAYLQGGAGTGVARSTLTGVYFERIKAYFKRHSASGHHTTVTQNDTTPPTIVSMQASYAGYNTTVAVQLNEPGIVQAFLDAPGVMRAYHPRYDAPTSTFQTMHMVSIPSLGVEKDYALTVKAMDQAGNIRVSIPITLRLPQPMCQCPCPQ